MGFVHVCELLVRRRSASHPDRVRSTEATGVPAHDLWTVRETVHRVGEFSARDPTGVYGAC
ncbi:hypothetical protein RHCRD62_10090 [Rhodococcus sp. RD6.2]|nr:hypothetical protein RHCRD62_10090 [Rhodococcus sp. RD6.2]